MHSTTRIRSALLCALGAAVVLAQAACGGGARSRPRSGCRSARSGRSTERRGLRRVPPARLRRRREAAAPRLLPRLRRERRRHQASLERLFDTAIPQLIKSDEWPAARPFIVLMPQHLDPSGGVVPRRRRRSGGSSTFAMKHYDVDPTRSTSPAPRAAASRSGTTSRCTRTRSSRGSSRSRATGARRSRTRGATSARCRSGPSTAAPTTRRPGWARRKPMHEIKTCTDPKPIDARATIYPGVGHNAWTRRTTSRPATTSTPGC